MCEFSSPSSTFRGRATATPPDETSHMGRAAKAVTCSGRTLAPAPYSLMDSGLPGSVDWCSPSTKAGKSDGLRLYQPRYTLYPITSVVLRSVTPSIPLQVASVVSRLGSSALAKVFSAWTVGVGSGPPPFPNSLPTLQKTIEG